MKALKVNYLYLEYESLRCCLSIVSCGFLLTHQSAMQYLFDELFVFFHVSDAVKTKIPENKTEKCIKKNGFFFSIASLN